MNGSSGNFVSLRSDSPASYINSSFLGIGTTTPTSTLQVKGSGTTSATTAFRVENANASGSMVVLDNGFVGIGTNTPLSKLDINIPLADSDGITFNTNDEKYSIWSNSNLNGLAINANAVGVSTRYDLFIAKSGNIGIGTITPNARLHISGTLLVDNSLLINKTSSSLASGTRTLDSSLTGSYSSAFYNYTISSGSNARAGQFIVVWNGGTVQYTDVSTLDIGSTSAIALTASLSGANLNVTTVLPSDSWTIKTLTNFL
jgi:hypothetical protein